MRLRKGSAPLKVTLTQQSSLPEGSLVLEKERVNRSYERTSRFDLKGTIFCGLCRRYSERLCPVIQYVCIQVKISCSCL